MFDFGLSFSHLMVIAILAVVVIGPKDLPHVLRRLGQFMNKMRGMARDFQVHVDDAMKDAGVSDIKNELQTLRTGVSAAMSPMQTALSAATSAAVAPAAASTTAKPTAPPTPIVYPSPAGHSFDNVFGAGTKGEVRIQGKALIEDTL